MKYFIILNIPDYWSVALRSTTLQLMNVEGQWNANLFQVLLWKISSIPIHQSLRIYGTYFTCAFNSYCLKFFIGMCVWGGCGMGCSCLCECIWKQESDVICPTLPLSTLCLWDTVFLWPWSYVGGQWIRVVFLWIVTFGFFPFLDFIFRCVCLYIHVSACSCRGQKKTLDSLQLEL